jgi:hypothetical protein
LDFTRNPLGFTAAQTHFTKILQKLKNPNFFIFLTLPPPRDKPGVFFGFIGLGACLFNSKQFITILPASTSLHDFI